MNSINFGNTGYHAKAIEPKVISADGSGKDFVLLAGLPGHSFGIPLENMISFENRPDGSFVGKQGSKQEGYHFTAVG